MFRRAQTTIRDGNDGFEPDVRPERKRQRLSGATRLDRLVPLQVDPSSLISTKSIVESVCGSRSAALSIVDAARNRASSSLHTSSLDTTPPWVVRLSTASTTPFAPLPSARQSVRFIGVGCRTVRGRRVDRNVRAEVVAVTRAPIFNIAPYDLCRAVLSADRLYVGGTTVGQILREDVLYRYKHSQ